MTGRCQTAPECQSRVVRRLGNLPSLWTGARAPTGRVRCEPTNRLLDEGRSEAHPYRLMNTEFNFFNEPSIRKTRPTGEERLLRCVCRICGAEVIRVLGSL